jgi:hypothetical protein
VRSDEPCASGDDYARHAALIDSPEGDL